MRKMKGFKGENTNFKIDFKVLKRIFSYMFDYKIRLFIIAVTTVFASLTGIIGTAFLKTVIDKYIEPLTKNYDLELVNGFIHILLIIAVIYLIGSICSYLSGRLTVTVVARSLYKIRTDLFNKMENLSIEYFDSYKHGELMSLYTNDIDALREMLTQTFSTYISALISIIGTFSMMFYYSWQLTLITIFVLFISLFFAKKIAKKSSVYFTEQQNELAKLNGFIEEIVEGQKVVKVFCHEELSKNDFQKVNDKLYEVSTKATTFASILFPVLINLLNINYILVAIIGSIFITKSIISIGILIPFIVYTRAIIDPIIELADQLTNILTALAGAKRIFEVIDKDTEIDDGKITFENDKKVDGRIEFSNVTFSYKNGENTLKSINLKANKGEKVALVGSTGAGKTTIISILNRFYDIQGGKITFDDIDIKDIKKSDLRKMFSMVLQDTHLFTDTIMENIRYGRLEAMDEEVFEAAKLANADKFILNLPNGYKTILTGDATNLSQGERQLLAIARAIISNRPVLILDEATSSIDTRTEKLIEDAMNNLIKNKTVFIIAHRLSTIRNSDKIVVLEHGEIIEQGSHDELLKNKGRYYELCNGLSELE